MRSLSASPFASRFALAGVALVALTLGACQSRKAVDATGSVPFEVSQRHPIVLSEAPRSIEIFPAGPRLGARQADDLARFAAEYRSHGRSRIVVDVPSHGGGQLAEVRAALAANGVPASALHVRSYPAEGYEVVSPIRLSYAKLQARVPHECGKWPEDLGTSNIRFSATNQPYWNLGCAYQSNIAAMVADPIDLERPRAEGRIDTARRMSNIEKLREGADPSTGYRDSATRINQSVGN
jgi:pilus assembly protein CpaD